MPKASWACDRKRPDERHLPPDQMRPALPAALCRRARRGLAAVRRISTLCATCWDLAPDGGRTANHSACHDPGPDRVLATSLYDQPAGELHEDASAGLREHLALPGCSILRRSSPGIRRERLPGSAGGHEEDAVANHRERAVFRDTALRISCRIWRKATTSGQRRPGRYLRGERPIRC
jgi:hypothetical protein